MLQAMSTNDEYRSKLTTPCQTQVPGDDNLKAKADKFKVTGNAEYNKKEFQNAVDLYTEGINVSCTDDRLNAVLYANRAAAHFYLGHYLDTLHDAKAARKFQPNNIKAIFRGARACFKLNYFEDAIRWCDQGLAIDHQSKSLMELKASSVNMRAAEEKTENESAKSETILTEEKVTERKMNHKEQSEWGTNSGDFTQSIEEHKTRLQEAISAGNRAEEGRAYQRLSAAYWNAGDCKKAIKFRQLHLEIAKETGDEVEEGNAYGFLAAAHERLSNYEKCIEYSQLRLRIAKEIGDRRREAGTYGNLGVAYRNRGEFKRAIEFHKLHLQIAKEVGDREGEESAYGNLGSVYINIGNFEQSIECYNSVLRIAKERGDKAREGSAYGGLGAAYQSCGKVKEAIKFHTLHLDILKETGDKFNEGGVYSNLGNAYIDFGDYEKAIEFHNKHLQISRKFGNREGEMIAYAHLGIVYSKLGHFEEAREYHKSCLSLSKEIGHRAVEGKAYGNLANTSWYLHDLKKAIEYYQQRLILAQDLGNKDEEGAAYSNLGNAYWTLHDFQQAIDYHKKHLNISKEIGDRSGEGNAYCNLGNAYQSMGEYEQAITYHELYINICKEVGDRFGVAKAHFQCGVSSEYQGNLDEALVLYKSAINELEEVRGHLLSKDEWKISLRNQYHMMYQTLQSLLLKQNKTSEALIVTEKGRAQALEDLMISQYLLERSPSDGQELGFIDLHTYTTSPVLYLAVQENDINAWFVQEGDDIHFRKTDVTAEQLKNNGVHDLQSLIQKTVKSISSLEDGRCEDRSMAELDTHPDTLREHTAEALDIPSPQFASQDEESENLRTLYDITIGTCADLIRGNDLIIVPEGPLFMAPFAAFLDPHYQHLCESLRIRVLPSLTSLKLITDSSPDYHSRKGALIVGDPCLKNVVKVTKRHQKPKPLFNQLPYAKKEAEMVSGILGIAPLIGEQATKKEVLSRLSKVALIHIAAHGDSERGEIALAPGPDIKNPTENDYKMTMAEVLNVRLRAQLVVLSCCHSGRGKIMAEGVVGIARAFLGAGARSVLVSLWALNDMATQTFMRRFYEQLVDGKNTSEALHQAMKYQRESSEYGSLKNWAPFVLIGDDVTLDFRQNEDAQNSE